MYKHIIFDLDGTILNTLEDLASATNWVCARRGWPVHEVEEFRYFVGNGAPKLLSRVVPDGVELTDAAVQPFKSPEMGGPAASDNAWDLVPQGSTYGHWLAGWRCGIFSRFRR